MARNKELTFEDKLKRLKEIVAELEAPELTLEKGMALYREGCECSRFCREKLENARLELAKWHEDSSCEPDLSQEDGLEGEDEL